MITVTNPYNAEPLGDRCCYWIFAYQLQKIHQQKVNVENFKDLSFFQKIYQTNDVGHFSPNAQRIIKYDTLSACELWASYQDHPKATYIPDVQIDLPQKFVVCQWDAKQGFRMIEQTRKEKIIEFYKKLGYEFVTIGGESKDSRLKNDLNYIAYAISKADYFVGADSGMMNVSKLILPLDKIHSYVNLKWSINTPNNKHDYRNMWDGRSLSGCIRSIYRMGAPINYCENLDNPIVY